MKFGKMLEVAEKAAEKAYTLDDYEEISLAELPPHGFHL